MAADMKPYSKDALDVLKSKLDWHKGNGTTPRKGWPHE